MRRRSSPDEQPSVAGSEVGHRFRAPRRAPWMLFGLATLFVGVAASFLGASTWMSYVQSQKRDASKAGATNAPRALR